MTAPGSLTWRALSLSLVCSGAVLVLLELVPPDGILCAAVVIVCIDISVRSAFFLSFCRQFLVCTCVLRTGACGFLRTRLVDTKGTVHECGERT